MKTMTKLGLAVTLLFLVSFFTQTNAQSHDIKARNCKYWKKSPNPGSGAEVTDFSVCKVCSEKKDKEAAAKRAEDKRRADALVAKTKADNERKAKEAAEKQRLQNEKNKPVNATIVMSPNTGKGTSTKAKTETDSKNLREWRTFEDKNSRPTKIGFNYYDLENQTEVITIPAKFDYITSGSIFAEGSKYAALDGGNRSNGSPCAEHDRIRNSFIIDRKGEVVIPARANIGYIIIPRTPFAIELSYPEPETWTWDACSAKIINIETKEVVGEFSPNYHLNEYGVTSQVLISKYLYVFYPNQKEYIINRNGDKYKVPEDFITNLQREFATKKYSAFFIYPEEYFSDSNQYTGFLLSNDGSYKVIRESWLRNLTTQRAY